MIYPANRQPPSSGSSFPLMKSNSGAGKTGAPDSEDQTSGKVPSVLSNEELSVASDADLPVHSGEELSEYENRLLNEQKLYKDDTNVHDLPDIFDYWSNKYLAHDMWRFGFSSPNEFFAYYIEGFLSNSFRRDSRVVSAFKSFQSNPNRRYARVLSSLKAFLLKPGRRTTHILSIGSGNCDLELEIGQKLLSAGLNDFTIECLELNEDMLERARIAASDAGMSDYFIFTRCDFNEWIPVTNYEIVMANQSLHHVMNLEGLFDAVQQSLKSDGLFLISDMIGRNGHMRWPEAMDRLGSFWDELPDSYRYNRLLNRHEEQYINYDCSTEGFEGIRAQDILPLLMERFNFNFFFPFGNIIFVFIDRTFGHNFDADADWDKDFIDRVHACDEACIISGELKPTSVLTVLTKRETELVLRHPVLTPQHCLRKTSVSHEAEPEIPR